MDNLTFEGFNVDYIPRECIYLFIIILIIIGVYLLTRNTSKIPKVIYQTYKDKNVPLIVKERWLQLNPGYEYHLYDDDDCYQFLLDYYDKEHADFFKYKIKDGPIKSDFWRVCILYQFGGIYADIDIKPLVPIDEFVNSDTTLYTCLSDPSISHHINPHFIAVTPKNKLIKECIDIYMNRIKNDNYSYWGYSITVIMKEVITKFMNKDKLEEGSYKINDQIIQFPQEVCPQGDRSNEALSVCFIEQNNKEIMYNRDSNLYNPLQHSFIKHKFFNELPGNPHLDIRYGKNNIDIHEIHHTLKDLLYFFMNYCKKNDIKPILMYGALIGYYFNKKMLPWDDDIDIILLEPCISKMKNYEDTNYLVEINPNSNYDINDIDNVISARVISKKNGLFIDIAYFKKIDEKLYCKDGNIYNVNDILPFKKGIFEGIDVYLPNNIENCLIKRYGNNVLKPVYNNWKFDYKTKEWYNN